MMYHHVNSDRCSNDLAMLERHLEYIANNFISIFPLDGKLPKNSICLVFDDGYYDFYKFIFPILKEFKLKAMLAVIPKYILDDTNISSEKRLGFEHNDLLKEYKNATLCTYKELKEMIDSGLVQVVSHSYSHKNLTEDGINIKEELELSKNILEDKLDIKVESFVYPFGKYNQKILDETKKYYRYAFRIGNGINFNFKGIGGVIYRIDGDNLKSPDEPFKFKNMIKYSFKSLIKSIAGNR